MHAPSSQKLLQRAGYSHLTGGKSGGQAQYSRVRYGEGPLLELLRCMPVDIIAVICDAGMLRAADVNLLKVPDSLPDSKVVLLSDVLPTAWHATELGAVAQGDRVAIWGAGPGAIHTAACTAARTCRMHCSCSLAAPVHSISHALAHAPARLLGSFS
jgi:threonine dehydrogenase-like Zn-dependent dehydrogenase